MSKRYYWLKLNENFFEREEMKVIENMPNGKDYIIFYMKLLLKSVGTEGILRFRDVIPYTPDMLASITNTSVDTVKVATDLFIKLGLMELWDDGALFMVETISMIGSETDSAKRMRKLRYKQEKKELLPSHCDEGVQESDTDIEIDIDTDIEIDKELDKDKEIDIDTTLEKPVSAPHKEIVELYNSICISFNSVKQITNNRKGNMNARYRENGCNVEVFRTVFNKVQNSSFLKKGWDTGGKADFEWIMRPTNFVKILEGKYDDKSKPSSKNQNNNLSKLEEMYQKAVAEEGGFNE